MPWSSGPGSGGPQCRRVVDVRDPGDAAAADAEAVTALPRVVVAASHSQGAGQWRFALADLWPAGLRRLKDAVEADRDR
jgi:hypothetical protein